MDDTNENLKQQLNEAFLTRYKLFKDLWAKEYSNKTLKEKADYMTSQIYGAMRVNGESYNNEYKDFSIEWYKMHKEIIPEFDLVLVEVMKLLDMMVSVKAFYSAINKPIPDELREQARKSG